MRFSTMNSSNFSGGILSDQIRAEIQRFESVHPSIYALYDLLDVIPDPNIREQMRSHVVAIEDSFVNSQEWTVSRLVPDIRLGVLGSMCSGKSALVHRYLTGSFLQEESPEGGRFKKEVVVDGKSNLLLIRDEGTPPDEQFSMWVDAVVFIFSLESETSFTEVMHDYLQLSKYRNIANLPVLLVGTQDSISTNQPRLIEESRAKKLAQQLNKANYYETCAVYGLNVEKVFRDACLSVVHQRQQLMHGYFDMPTSSCPPTPSHMHKFYFQQPPPPGGVSMSPSRSLTSLNKDEILNDDLALPLTTPTATPGSQRKNRRISNIFRRGDDNKTPSIPFNQRISSSSVNMKLQNGSVEHAAPVGEGRTIPIKQGYLHKKSNKSFNRNEWKKKFVVLVDGKIWYYPSAKDFGEDNHRKEIFLGHVTVKVPQTPRERPKSHQPLQNGGSSGIKWGPSSSALKDKDNVSPVLLTGFDATEQVSDTQIDLGSEDNVPVTNAQLKKKKHVRKNSGFKASDLEENCSFGIVSLDNREWWFEASSSDEKDEWVRVIQAQILASLQLNVSRKSPSSGDPQSLLEMPGNSVCADCGQSDPSWASLNLGVLICIDCSGIHRQLGSHISRVRSLQLDQWPDPLVAMMSSLGNARVNLIWEARCPSHRKPSSECDHSQKRSFIIAKYQQKEFIAPLQTSLQRSKQDLLLDAISRRDLPGVLSLVIHFKPVELNEPSSTGRIALHEACKLGAIECIQLLLWESANANTQDRNGNTAWNYANISGNSQCQKLLLSADNS